ncbi:MAG TPA: sulfurtransferase [Gammaproteobacteria bacterium]|nr:sulfurtransferase [Gammaproteobacteria bacterium]
MKDLDISAMFRTLISSKTLADNIDNPDWIIVDCRYDLADPAAGRQAYLSGHIPGAVFADIHDDLSGPPETDRGRHPLPAAEQLQSLFRRLGINNDSQVIVYDSNGGAFAGRLWWLLRYMNHPAVALLDGGWPAWIATGGTSARGRQHNSPGHFTGTARRDWLVTVSDIPAGPVLIDSRDAARYRGDEEPIDKVAGHIPGALNRPWKTNLDDQGYFKPAAQLHGEFEQLLQGQEPASAVFYCGSGVTACHNLLAAVHAGLSMPRLYAGSWSDWCSDPSRPVARGNSPGTL